MKLVVGKQGKEALVSAISALPLIASEPGQAHSFPERAVDYFNANAQHTHYRSSAPKACTWEEASVAYLPTTNE